MIIPKNDFVELFHKANISISDVLYEKFSTYSKELVEYNSKINLTAITDPLGISEKHFLDSVYPFTMIDIKEGASVIDVGTGAGFPSLPLKIMKNDIQLTLLDSLKKRCVFLENLSTKLCLNVETFHGRAEEFGHKDNFREKFDIATARAVANLSELTEYCLPFVKVGGNFVALKGSSGEMELASAENAIKILGGKCILCKKYTLPSNDTRYLIVIKKISQTPTKYPRNKGQMTKRPL